MGNLFIAMEPLNGQNNYIFFFAVYKYIPVCIKMQINSREAFSMDYHVRTTSYLREK